MTAAAAQLLTELGDGRAGRPGDDADRRAVPPGAAARSPVEVRGRGQRRRAARRRASRSRLDPARRAATGRRRFRSTGSGISSRTSAIPSSRSRCATPAGCSCTPCPSVPPAARVRRGRVRLGGRAWLADVAAGPQAVPGPRAAHEELGGRGGARARRLRRSSSRRAIRCSTSTCCWPPTAASIRGTASCTSRAGRRRRSPATAASGIAAGEEIVRWFASQLCQLG